MTTEQTALLRNEFVHWLSIAPWDFFLTLNLNRESTYVAGRTHFKNFCQRLDRKTVGPRYWNRSEKRAVIIALPEHMDTNFHLHCLVNFRLNNRVSRRSAEGHFESSWNEVIASGSTHLSRIPEKYTLARYVTKELSRKSHYEKVILSSEFWP